MFSDAENSVDRTARFESYKSELSKAIANPVPVRQERSASGQPIFRKSEAAPESLAQQVQKGALSGELQKAGASPELVASLTEQLARAELQKTSPTSDLQIGSPTMLYAYDLEAGAKILAPWMTPLRNRIPREKGVGTAHEFRRITGFTGSGTGGLGLISPGITESTSNTFGPGNVGLARGPKIQYTGDSVSVPYLSFSMSTDVSWQQQFAGIGFEDTRQLSQNALLWSSMSMEEHLLLGGRGTKSGFGGALAGPTFTATPRSSKTTGEVGCSATIVTLYVAVTTMGHWGESVPTVVTVGSSTMVSADVLDLTITDVPGALGYRVYIGTSNTQGAGSGVQANQTVYTGLFPAQVSGPVAAPGAIAAQPGTKAGVLTVNFTGAATAGVPNAGANPVTTDSTASANHYDGILSSCTDPTQSGYTTRLNNTFAGADGANVGNTFSTAFSAMWTKNKANPDEILAAGVDRKQISDQLKTQSSSNYEIVLNADDVSGATIGSIVNAVYNPVTNKRVALTVHPWLEAGTLPIISWALNLPDSNVSNTFTVFNVQEYLGITWPQIQFLYEESSYWQGSLVGYAPAWQGSIQGVLSA
jgi:hypothetical protein